MAGQKCPQTNLFATLDPRAQLRRIQAAPRLLDALNPFKKGSGGASPKPAAPKPPQKAGPSREDTAKVKERCMAKVLILVDQGVITSGQVEKYYEEMVEDELSKLR